MTQGVILWDVENLGYLAIMAGAAVAKGELVAGATGFDGGKLGKMEVAGDHIILGKPVVFTKENIDQFKF